MKIITHIYMKDIFNKILLIAVLVCLFACAPTSKEDYMKEFESFVNEVSVNWRSYTPEDWEEKVAKYNQLTGEWLLKFEGQLSTRDAMRLAAYQIKWGQAYMLGCGADDINAFIDALDMPQMRENVRQYVESEMEGDVQDWAKDMKQAEQETEDIIDEALQILQGIEIE